MLGCEPADDPVENGGDESTGTDSADDDDNNDFDTDGFEDDDDDDDTDTQTDDICAEWAIELTPLSVRMMIFQDMSGSMNEEAPTKWQQARAALTNTLGKFDDRIEIGFDRFPNELGPDPFPDWCKIDEPVLADTALLNAAQVIEILESCFPDGFTPLHMGMSRFTEPGYAPNFQSKEATSYLLVVSDGADTCGVDGDEDNPVDAQKLADLTATLLAVHQIKTFVIGFGSGVEPAQLNAIAAQGGTPFTEYLDAQNQADLEAALDEIGAVAISCVYDITPQDDDEVDMDEVAFYFDEIEVGWDDGCAFDKGWTWVGDDYTKVEFCKEACDQLQGGLVDEISATFGCPPIPITE